MNQREPPREKVKESKTVAVVGVVGVPKVAHVVLNVVVAVVEHVTGQAGEQDKFKRRNTILSIMYIRLHVVEYCRL